MYLESSPDYCEADLSRGVLGTKGRLCNISSLAIDGCDLVIFSNFHFLPKNTKSCHIFNKKNTKIRPIFNKRNKNLPNFPNFFNFASFFSYVAIEAMKDRWTLWKINVIANFTIVAELSAKNVSVWWRPTPVNDRIRRPQDRVMLVKQSIALNMHNGRIPIFMALGIF